MSVYANNILQTVQTYQRGGLASYTNLACLLTLANKRFRNFDEIGTNLGSTVTFDLQPRAIVNQGLVVNWQPAIQRVQTLTCDQAANASFSVSAEQLIFNLDKGEESYMKVFAEQFMAELANSIEANIGLNFISSVAAPNTGVLYTNSGPYRFYGNGTTNLSSFGQLAQSVTQHATYSTVRTGIKYILPDIVVPSIVTSGLGQFAPLRNDRIAYTYELGSFGSPVVEYYNSNLLPQHTSGNTGVNAQTLTVVSTNDPTGQNVTQITFSGATASDLNAVFAGDLFVFNNGVSGFNNLCYLTFVGHIPSAAPVQFRATANAAANASGQVVVNITPALNWAGGNTQNLQYPIQAGMQVSGLPSHRAGCIISGDSLFLAMPRLPDQVPFPTANETDMDTGANLRATYGTVYGQNQLGLTIDCVWGSTLVPELTTRVIVPLTQY
jgi:hypothetical protein